MVLITSNPVIRKYEEEIEELKNEAEFLKHEIEMWKASYQEILEQLS